ncbi:MAG: hypothetical protein KDC35_19225 [Acidobacteria bacterium]|nr:hypothetical protein [Acidobacteriota bacterium]
MDKTRCDSCGMPIQSGVYCQYCVDEQGHLQSFEIRFEKMVQWVLANEPETSREEAEQLTRANMKTLPAWRNHPNLVG